jgi:hypothetical protein
LQDSSNCRRDKIAGTPEAITDTAFLVHLGIHLPAAYETTFEIAQWNKATIEATLDALKKKEIRLLRLMERPKTCSRDGSLLQR